MSETILSIRDLKVNYGGIEAVKGISFDVPKGNSLTLIGAKRRGQELHAARHCGTGQTQGRRHRVRRRKHHRQDTTVIGKKGITLVPEGPPGYPDLTVLENLRVGA